MTSQRRLPLPLRVGLGVLLGLLLAAGASIAIPRIMGASALAQVPAMSAADLDRVLAQSASALSLAEAMEVDNAFNRVIEVCMQEAGWEGFDYPEAKASESPPFFMTDHEQWTFVDVESANEMGYGVAQFTSAVAAWEESRAAWTGPYDEESLGADNDRYFGDLFGEPDEAVEILERDGFTAGIAAGGCLGRALRSIWGDVENYLALQDAHESFRYEAWETALQSTEVRAALRVWRSCMTSEGHDYEDPPAAVEASLEAARSGSPDFETDVAIADAKCKIESRLADAIIHRFDLATTALAPELGDQANAYRALEEQALSNARQLDP